MTVETASQTVQELRANAHYRRYQGVCPGIGQEHTPDITLAESLVESARLAGYGMGESIKIALERARREVAYLENQALNGPTALHAQNVERLGLWAETLLLLELRRSMWCHPAGGVR